jgi:DNA-directed RNA polymerase specialized sigma24 family protein
MQSNIERCYPKILMFFRRRKPEMAEDLAQETMVRALLKLQQGAPLTTDLCWYLLGIARRVLLEEWRKPVVTELDPNRHGIEQKSPGLEALENAIYRKELSEEIFRGISPADRQLFSDYQLGSSEELSTGLGITANALRIRVFRIKQRILANVEDAHRRNIT